LKNKAGRTVRVAVLIADANSPFGGRGDENFDYAGAEESDRIVLEAVRKAGFEADLVQVHLGNLDRTIESLDCDVVLNLCDGTGAGRDGGPGVEVIEALERRGLPYTGARAEAYRIGSDKADMGRRFQAARVPTPPFQVFSSTEAPLDPVLRGRFPLIVKPRDSGGSVGIHLTSVVADEPALRERLAAAIAVYGEALAAEYIAGREVTVGILGSGRRLRVFPPLEVRFGSAFPPGLGLRTFSSKWDVNSPRYGNFDLLCPAPLTPAEESRVLRVARAAYRAIHGSGYGRVDIRLDERGPFVIEVNPNCSLEWSDHELADCGMFPITAHAAGWTYPRLLRALLGHAMALARPRRTVRIVELREARQAQSIRSKTRRR
jgi:D-alanine-D-alanine ligase